MCGIAGILNFDGRPVRPEDLRRMTDRMLQRGPDDEGFFAEGSVGIGMRRLSIIDLAGGHQPIANEDGTLWIVMNGEIYNHVELRADLKARGHVFKTFSDTEVILHLYEEKGVEAVSDLNGMFVFALWDARRRALWLVRDRLGIKPVYYALSDERVLFASDLNAIRACGRLQLSRDAILQYLALSYVPSPQTIYEGATKLPAASYLWIEDRKVQQRRYWNVPPIGTWRGSIEHAEEQLTELLHDAVRLQLRSDVPMGLLLSGGFDSSAIAVIAAAQMNSPINALTVDFFGKNSPDASCARIVARQTSARHYELALDLDQAIASLDELVPFLDEPIADSAIIPSYALSKLARERGLKVLLSGAGGDELFGGYARHWAPRFGGPTWVAETLPIPVRQTIASAWSLFQPARGARAADPLMAWAADISGVDFHACREILREPEDFDVIMSAIRNEFVDLAQMRQSHGRAYGGMVVDLSKYLVEDVLALNDKTTMAASVEGRVPLLDHRVVEFAFSLPPELNLAGAKAKGLLRRAIGGKLPNEVLNRRKDGFSAPLIDWISRSRRMNLEAELLDQPVPIVSELILPKALEKLLGNTSRRRAAAHTLFALFLLNRWCRLRREIVN